MAAVSADESTFEQSLEVFSRSRTRSSSICFYVQHVSQVRTSRHVQLLTTTLRYCVISHVLPVMAAIFDLPVTSTSERVHLSPVVLLNPENVGVAFGTLSLSSIEAEILRHFACTSGNGGHL